MHMSDFEWKIPVTEALGQELYKTSLNLWLTSNAEQMANEDVDGFCDAEAEARIEVRDGYFVVKFLELNWREKLKPGDEVFWSDPDEHSCSRTIHILSIHYGLDGACTIQERDGTDFECFLKELS